MKYTFMIITFISGAILPVQVVFNTRMGRQTGGPLMGALISFMTGFICLIILNGITNAPAFTALRPLQVKPGYVWLGGVIGAVFVGYITWVNQRQGVALTFALVVSGQIFISLLIDHFGMFGSIVQSITWQKILGAACIIAGIILIKNK